jgi:hypothetical protein
MSASGIPLQAHLVIDNSLIVLLQEYWCETYLIRVSSHDRVSAAKHWLAELLAILASFTPDGLIHCTDCVAGEYKPQAGRLGQVTGISHQDCRAFANYISSLLHQTHIDDDEIRFLRTLPDAPKRLIDPGGVSDSDLSLLVLGARLSGGNAPVYVLTHDQDLLDFTSWTRTRITARAKWPYLLHVEGLLGLTYLENVHRDCRISTQEMQSILNFTMIEHYVRTDIRNSQKGKSIMQQLTTINTNLVQSAQIKTRGVAA